jgi:hypothetical protein
VPACRQGILGLRVNVLILLRHRESF